MRGAAWRTPSRQTPRQRVTNLARLVGTSIQKMLPKENLSMAKDSVSTDLNSTLRVHSPLRPSRTVPAVPESYGDDNDASFETKQVRLNTSDLATTTAKTFIEKESSNAAEEKVSILQRQNRTLLKQIVAMKQANAYSGTNSVTFGNTSNRLTNTDMATTLSRSSVGMRVVPAKAKQ